MSARPDDRVAFLQNNAINESLGLCDLAGHLKARGVATRLFLRREERALPERLRSFDPRLVVIPCDLLGHNAALGLARMAKSATRAPVVLGGTHPTFFPNVVLRDGVDFAFAGEAEGVVAELLDAVREGRSADEIPNLIRRDGAGYRANPLRPIAPDLDGSPMPDREIYFRYPFMAAFPVKKFSTGRGCHNACGFCFNPSYRAMLSTPRGFFRRKGADRIVREIIEVRGRHPLAVVHFSDDLFSSGEEWLGELMEAYRGRVGLPYSCNTFATTINERTVPMMKDGGCRVVALGLEIADDRLRREVMNKPITADEVVNATRQLKEAGIRVVTFNILGLPWSSIDGDLDTLALNQRIGADHTRTTILVPFPKSAMAGKLAAAGYLAADFEDRIYEVADLPAWPSGELFRQRDADVTRRLYRLWPLLLRLRLSKRLARRLVTWRWSALLALPALFLAMNAERRIFGFGWRAGIRYFLHVRSPNLKTSNYVSFI